MPARPLTVALLTVALVAGLPGAAGAATTISLASSRLTVIGDAFANAIVVRRLDDGYSVADPRARLEIEPGAPCFFTSNTSSPHEAKCLRSSELDVSVAGRAGDDDLTVTAGARATFLDGEAGADRLQGGPDPDTLRGGAGADLLLGGGGDDLLNGEAGADGLHGGAGTDTVSYSDRSQAVTITLPVDALEQRADDGNIADGAVPGFRDTIADDIENAVGGDGSDTLVGDNGPNRLEGRAGLDTLSGRGGDDTLDGGVGPDKIAGNDGIDRVLYTDRIAPVTVTLDGQPGDGNPTQDVLVSTSPVAGASENVGADVEAVVGGKAADTLIGDNGPNQLDGGAGDDELDGAGGADRLDGDDGDDTLDGGSGPDNVAGGPGVDSVSYASRTDPVTVSLDGIADDGNAQDLFTDNLRPDVENLNGTVGDDVLRGSAGDNVLDGFFGNNRLEGLGGNDTLTASSRGSDVLDGGGGTDTASYRGSGFDGVTVTLDGLANDGAAAGAGVPAGGEADQVLAENVIGTEFDDVITGNDDINRLNGGGGDDTLRGAGGGDPLLGGPGLDTLLGEAGLDVVNANDGFRDRIDCGPDPDVANLDLQDAVSGLRGGGLLPATAGCEIQNAAPAGQLPNVTLSHATVRIDRRDRARVALRCPRRSERRCTGTLRLQRRGGPQLARGRFSIPRGRHASVMLRLRRDERAGPAQILTRERDATGRAKHTLAPVRLR